MRVSKYGKYIQKTPTTGRYRIYKYRNHTNEYYGTYDTLEEAKRVRDKLIETDWDKSIATYKRNMDKKMRYIRPIQSKKGTHYIILKNNGEKLVHWGTFHTLQDAMNERDFLIQCDWNEDKYYELLEGEIP